MEKDFYTSEVDPVILKQRGDYISERWTQLHEVSTKAADETKKFLFIVNAGGAVAVLSFIGVNETSDIALGAKSALILFCLGVVSVGILHARITHRLYDLFTDWRENCSKYWNQEIGYTQLTTEDEKKTDSDKCEFVIGYISAAFFLAGLIVGGVTLLN
ncbi:hypothetical protein [Tichowtungia aerotolerans]|uniref:Uncharacterized protein n=1 Tax=Tichowtungia aerotolerans TaxID=2697043 RepID=A0A6P1M9V6_9BACT|nr:hypothetical protein [Tichowtungia aerotolerans]QHI67905.1 hypothetical protein GT409_00060 [Tichowtungia aerotolerans]